MNEFWTAVVLFLSSLAASVPVILHGDATAGAIVAYPMGMLGAAAIYANGRYRKNATDK